MKSIKYLTRLSPIAGLVFLSVALAENPQADLPSVPKLSSPTAVMQPPVPPTIEAKAYILVDADSGKILASNAADEKFPPASLTKMMTMHVISESLSAGRIHLDDKVLVSKKASVTGGSRMFLKPGEEVSVMDLSKGIIIDSGNDACVAMAEYLAGGEDSFADLMNQQAQALGMTNTHFVDSTGLPSEDHYSTAKDMSILARTIVQKHPEQYDWYKEKWFTFNNIRQPNRNRLLWWDNSVDGIKTGHTDEAGYCLVASAKRQDMRLISVVMGAKTDNARAVASQNLLNYGYRFFETHRLYQADAILVHPRIWKGSEKTAAIGVDQDIYVTVPTGQYSNLKTYVQLPKILKAPIHKGDMYGTLILTIGDQPYAEYPLVALDDNPRGGFWRRAIDSISLFFHQKFGKK